MSAPGRREIVFHQDIPIKEGCAVLAARSEGYGLVQVSAHSGRPAKLCDVLALGDPDRLGELLCLEAREKVADSGERQTRSMVVGMIHAGKDDLALTSALDAVAAGADGVELAAGKTSAGDLVQMACTIRRLGQHKVRVFVDAADELAATTAAEAGACAVTTGGLLAPSRQLAVSDSAIIIRRTESLLGTDPLCLVYQVMASLSRNLAAAKDVGVHSRRIILDPGLDREVTPLQAAMLYERLRTLGRLGYPLIVGPHWAAANGDDRLAALAAGQLRCIFGGADYVRARGTVEIAQAAVLADRLIGTVA